jgi:GTP cyclohydrolase IA
MDREKIKQGVRMILEGIGEDPDRSGLKETPDRVARMYEEICGGMNVDPVEMVKTLDSDSHDEIVLIRNIPFYSMCEHHLLPFIGVAHVAYLPAKDLMGISKLARIVDVHSRRLQIQERLTTDVAESIMQSIKPRGTLAIIEAEHLCMTMRGVKKPGARTVTSVVRGIFRENAATRSEAMSLIMGANS